MDLNRLNVRFSKAGQMVLNMVHDLLYACIAAGFSSVVGTQIMQKKCVQIPDRFDDFLPPLGAVMDGCMSGSCLLTGCLEMQNESVITLFFLFSDSPVDQRVNM